MVCCKNGHEVCARMLVDAKAAVDAAKSDGSTALMLCCQNGHEACARVLVDAGAAVDTQDAIGITALVLAAARADTTIVRSLRNAGACKDRAELPSGATCCTVDFCTVGFPDVVATNGQVFYEVALAHVGTVPQIGWATAGFAPGGGNGVGDDVCSWGADGVRRRLWHNGKEEWPVSWKKGDVVGCAADLEQGTVWFGLNGEWVVAFEQSAAKWPAGLFPALTGSRMAFTVLATPRFAGPTPAFRNIAPGTQPVLLVGQEGAIYVTA